METRQNLLESINAELTARGLKPLSKLGDASKGEIEIAGIAEIYDHSKRFFVDVKFDVRFPNGSAGAFTVRFNANGAVSDGAVMVVLINGQFAIVKQWRLPLAHWTYEMPRGFGEKLDAAQVNGRLGTLRIGDLPLGTLARELGEEVMSDAQLTSITHLGNIAENSGTSAVCPSYFLVQLAVDPAILSARLSGSEHLSVKLWDTQKVRAEFGQKLCDNHSLTALALAFRHMESLPKLS
jgi:hypothetical protein